MITYEDIVPTLKTLFPEIVDTEGYIPANESVPYAFVADLIDLLREKFQKDEIRVDDPRMEKLFSIISELQQLPPEENKEIVAAGFFESMLHGITSDKFFIDAAKKYLNDDMWRIFRIVQTQHIGDPNDFVDTESR